MKMRVLLVVVFVWLSSLFLLFWPPTASVQVRSEDGDLQPIKSLSESDLFELRAGNHWRLAKAAELNGVPGPDTLIRMKKELALSTNQSSQLERQLTIVKQRAIPLGQRLINLEKELNESFAKKTIGEEDLARLLDEIAVLRTKLRFLYLSATLQSLRLLSAEQIAKYKRLRSFKSVDPCSSPEANDPNNWKEYHHC